VNIHRHLIAPLAKAGIVHLVVTIWTEDFAFAFTIAGMAGYFCERAI
jgi:hypothetical protein